MKEADLQRRIQDGLRKRGYWCVTMHGNQYMRKGLPDLLVFRPVISVLAAVETDKVQLDMEQRVAIGCMLEVKLPGKKLTMIQEDVIDELRSYGVRAGVVTNLDEAIKIIE